MSGRRALGWALVVAAVGLLLAQVLAGILRPAAGQAQVARSSRGRLDVTPSAIVVEPAPSPAFVDRRDTPRPPGLYVARFHLVPGGGARAATGVLDYVDWNGVTHGTFAVSGMTELVDSDLWQSPDGSHILVRANLVDAAGGVTDLAALAPGIDVRFGAWRDDGLGFCAPATTGAMQEYLDIFSFHSGGVLVRSLALPGDWRVGGQNEVAVLACSAVRSRALVANVGLSGSELVTENLGSGAVLARRQYAYSNLTASPDGRLLALSGAPQAQPAAVPPAEIRAAESDALLRRLSPGAAIRAFNGDGTAVLVEPASGGGPAIIRVSDGVATWADKTRRRLVSWLARPGSRDFALEMALSDTSLCQATQAEDCAVSALEDLELVSGAAETQLGKGVGAWTTRF